MVFFLKFKIVFQADFLFGSKRMRYLIQIDYACHNSADNDQKRTDFPSSTVRREVVNKNQKPITKSRKYIDYRKLNNVSKGYAFPIHNMDTLQKARYISTLDLSQAFNQISVAEQWKNLTAFVVCRR